MEEWIELSDADAAVGFVADDGNAKKNLRFAFDLDFQIEKYRFDSCKERLRSLFDQVLVDFLRDKSAKKFIRPIPALCSDGRPVDLFKLFWLVWKIGGHDRVSRNNLWSFVSEECGSGFGVVASIKLIYMKYLNELDQWLRHRFSKRVLEDDYGRFVQKLDLLSRELEIRFRGLPPNEQKQEERMRDIKFVKCSKDTDKSINVVEKTVNEKNGFSKGQIDVANEVSDDIVASAAKIIEKVINKILIHEVSVANDDEKLSFQDKNGACKSATKVGKKVAIKTFDHSEKITDNEEKFSVPKSCGNPTPSGTDVGNVLVSRKRKRQFESFSGMLSWLTHVAKHSNDPSVGLIPECSQWNDCESDDFWAQALFVREALLIRRHANKSTAEVLTKDKQKKPKMHPSMYENDVLDNRSSEKLRFSTRTPSTKSHLCPCCSSCAAPQSKDSIRQGSHVGTLKKPVELVVTDVKELPSEKNYHEPSDVQAEKEVSVGPLFQAEVPQWTDIPSESDPKWLGTRMWAPENGEENSMIRFDPVGKGRHDTCNCPFPGSVECVRFHVAEKRLKLKQEIGSLFYRWRFNRMGEEISLSWTEGEEKTFKDNMRSYASFSNKFWSNACKFLPSKSREKLVSYYFNVYLIQRRSYQNRVTPKDVDSDDDEKVCGTIGGSLGYKVLTIPGSKSIPCTLNQESTELL